MEPVQCVRVSGITSTLAMLPPQAPNNDRDNREPDDGEIDGAVLTKPKQDEADQEHTKQEVHQ